MKDLILQKSSELLDKIWNIRCHIHQHPELSYKEFETQKYVHQRLSEIGFTNISKSAETGLVAILNETVSGPCILLRADLDALPIFEKNQQTYTSQNEGVMHACGHDFHTANLLGVAEILFHMKDEIKGCIKFIFQPGEEKNPGGASIMIEDKVLENPLVDYAFALHVFPSMKAGKVGFFKGLYMASCDEIYIKIIGKGGHAAVPSLNIDPIPVMCKLLLAFDEIRNTGIEKNLDTILAFGKVEALGATNIIPDEVNISGTFRAMDETWRNEVKSRLKSICEKMAKETNTIIELNVDHGYPCLVNDDSLTQKMIESSQEILGNENVLPLEKRMSSEDFAFFSQKIPVCFYRVGTDNEAGDFKHNVHTPLFDVDKNALLTSMRTLAYGAVKSINSHHQSL